ncbi:hypothetical protein Tco_0054665, partial [Tanacetum coccineum]
CMVDCQSGDAISGPVMSVLYCDDGDAL